MKSLFTSIFCISFSFAAFAANLTATVSSSTGTGSKKGKINLTISGGIAPYTILWTGPSGYSSSKLNPDSLAAGTYCVTVTDQYCGVAKLCVTIDGQTAGINELAQNRIKIYPNPFQNELFIELDDQLLNGKLSLKLYDQLGKIVAEKQMEAEKQIRWIFSTSLATGVYILNIQNENGVVIKRSVTVTQ